MRQQIWDNLTLNQSEIYEILRNFQFMHDTKPKSIIGNKGPIVITGGVTLIHPDGLKEQRNGTVALCRCGLSAKKPYCNGSH